MALRMTGRYPSCDVMIEAQAQAQARHGPDRYTSRPPSTLRTGSPEPLPGDAYEKGRGELSVRQPAVPSLYRTMQFRLPEKRTLFTA
ncbi:hypothetical protein GCM10010365_23710 [Streptomyces poonensis]|uniref:Uncharacterized protein n=1 Tax=Streptomyces poonensis TaxID=68255 RepID=A0A918PFC3_9ACTN|nr:hypothetical protein GCM10010365_23710 [Streptomyces poonensis]GLJ90810.1 hypothetical protein GCM10017589_34150 [Streptomyces poonensis]